MWQVSKWSILHALLVNKPPGWRIENTIRTGKLRLRYIYVKCQKSEWTTISEKQWRLKLTYQILRYPGQFRKKKHKIGNNSNYSSRNRWMVRVGDCCVWWWSTLRAVVGHLGLNASRSHKAHRIFRRKSVWEKQGGRRAGQVSLAAHRQADPKGIILRLPLEISLPDSVGTGSVSQRAK